MFRNLTNFSYQRSAKEAVGFYLAYLLLSAIGNVFLSGVLGVATQDYFFDFQYGSKAGNLLAIVISFGTSIVILKSKKLLGSFSLILLALVSGIMAVFVGGLGGLIPAAYLTTRPKNKGK